MIFRQIKVINDHLWTSVNASLWNFTRKSLKSSLMLETYNVRSPVYNCVESSVSDPVWGFVFELTEKMNDEEINQ